MAQTARTNRGLSSDDKLPNRLWAQNQGLNELLIREAIKSVHRDKVFIAVKFGAPRDYKGNFIGHDSRPVAVQNFLAYSLQRLRVDYIDLYYPSRVDPNVPIKDTVARSQT